MNSLDNNQPSPGENIDLSIGSENMKYNNQQNDTSYFEDQMLGLMKYQAKCIGQIKNILIFFLILSILIIIVSLLH